MKKFHYYFIPLVLQRFGYLIVCALQKFFLRLEIRGRENLKNISGPVILAPNHTSELDAPSVPLIFPFFSNFFPIYYTTHSKEKYKKKERFGWRSLIYGGIFFDLLGGSSVYSGYKNYAISLRNHIYLLKRGNTICIFPEGKITLDGNISPARGGLGYLVHTTNATVIPVAIDTFYNLSWKEYLLRKRKVVITICEPMRKNDLFDTTNPKVEHFRNAGEIVLNKIKEKLIK